MIDEIEENLANYTSYVISIYIPDCSLTDYCWQSREYSLLFRFKVEFFSIIETWIISRIVCVAKISSLFLLLHRYVFFRLFLSQWILLTAQQERWYCARNHWYNLLLLHDSRKKIIGNSLELNVSSIFIINVFKILHIIWRLFTKIFLNKIMVY